MPATHTLHVLVTRPLLDYVRWQVTDGHDATASELVRAALREHAADPQGAPKEKDGKMPGATGG